MYLNLEESIIMQGNKSVLFITTISSFLTPFMGSAINIALPAIGKELGMNTLILGWVATSYLVTAAVFLLPFGKLADRNGRKRLYISGIILFGFASLLTAFSWNSAFLIAARLLNGIGGAMIYSTALAILTSAYPKEKRGRVLGINVASVYLGLSLGPTIGGYLTVLLGWQSIFLFTSLLSILILPIAIFNLPNDHKKTFDTGFDLNGSIVYGFGIAAIIYGFPHLPGVLGIVLVITGISGLVIFAFIENQTPDPIINIGLFRKNLVFVFSNLAAFINYSATYALVFLMSIYLQQVGNYSAAEAGLIIVSQPVMMTIISPIAGKLSDRFEPRIVASAGMALTVTGLFTMSFITAKTGVPFIVAVLMLLGLGFALFSSPNTNAVMSSVKQTEYGIASATLGTMRLTGQTMSMGITLLVIALFIGNTGRNDASDEQLLKGIKFTFTVFAFLCIAGTWFSLRRGKVRPEKQIKDVF
ncbi:MAG: MFS transporter [Bacteroidota bacterium]